MRWLEIQAVFTDENFDGPSEFAAEARCGDQDSVKLERIWWYQEARYE